MTQKDKGTNSKKSSSERPSVNKVSTPINLTDYKKMEQHLIDEHSYQEAIVDTVREPLIILDKDLRVVSANRSFYETFKTFPNESEGKLIYTLVNHQWDIPQLRKLLEDILPQKSQFRDFEVAHIFENIGQRTMLFNAREIRRSDGKERLILLAIEDITDRKQAEETLRESSENYRAMVNQAVAGILKTDLSGNIIFSNEQFGIMLGYTVEELLHKNMADLVHEKDLRRHNEMFESIKKGNEGYVIEKRMIRKDGSYIWVNNYNSPLYIAGNNLQSIVVVSIDITNQKNIEKQKDDFIVIASHEFKTPLTSIKAYAELLQEAFDKNEKNSSASLINKLIIQVNRLNQLVYTMLDTARIAGNRLKLNPVTFNLNNLIKELVTETQLTTLSHQLLFKPGKIKLLHADRERIGQVVDNFISNAIKYSPNADKIIISTTEVKNKVKVSIRDFGIGLSEGEIQRLFKRFYRVNPSGNTSGFGLGLYISMEIIKMHGGEIGVERRDVGSIFYFVLPYNPKEMKPV